MILHALVAIASAGEPLNSLACLLLAGAHLPLSAGVGLWRLLLAIALVGTLSSTIFLGLVLLAAMRNLRHARAQSQAAARVERAALPAVTILKPLHGAEPRLEENLESFFLQDYPAFEILFACRTADDPALAVVERLCARNPQVAARVVLSGEPHWPNAKVWSLDKMIAASTNAFLVISDSDVLVGSDFLRNVIPPLLQPHSGAGLVTCLYRGVPASVLRHKLAPIKAAVILSGASRVFCGLRSRRTPMQPADLCHALRTHYTRVSDRSGVPCRVPASASGLCSSLEALGMSVELSSGVITAEMLEGMRFALGSVMALRRDVLEKIGGIASTSQYYSDDFVLGNRIHAAGYKVILSHYRVAHVLSAQSFRQTFAAQLRWMQSTRYSRPRGHLGAGLTFALPFGILGLAAAAALAHPALGLALLAWSLLNRILQSIAVGYGVIGDRRALRLCWLYPLRDLLGFILWLASYCAGSHFRWRGELYRFTPGGKIISVERERPASPD